MAVDIHLLNNKGRFYAPFINEDVRCICVSINYL